MELFKIKKKVNNKYLRYRSKVVVVTGQLLQPAGLDFAQVADRVLHHVREHDPFHAVLNYYFFSFFCHFKYNYCKFLVILGKIIDVFVHKQSKLNHFGYSFRYMSTEPL